MVDHEEQHRAGAAEVSWRGLEGMFDSFHARLDPEHARVFRLVGAHPSPEFGAPAVAVLAALEPDSAALALRALTREHLLEQVAPDRYRMHPVLHDYAAHHAGLHEGPDARREAVARVLGWYAAVADQADRLLYPVSARLPVDLPAVQAPVRDREEAVAWLRSERAVLSAMQRTALEHGLHALVIALAVSSRHLGLGPRTWWPESLEAASRGIEAARLAQDGQAEEFLRVLRGHGHRAVGDLEAAETDFRAVEQAAQRSGDQVLRRRASAGLASVRQAQGRHDEAAEHFREMWEATRQEGDSAAEAVALGNLCLVNVARGRFEEALDFAQRAWELRSRTGNPLITAYAQDDLALARQGLGEHDTAIGLWEQAVAVYSRHDGADMHLAAAREAMAVSLSAAGRHDEAVHGLRQAADILTGLGDPRAEPVRQRAQDLVSARAGGPDRGSQDAGSGEPD